MAQFAFVFHALGDLPQEGVFHRDTSVSPDPPSRVWPNSQLRYMLRSKAPGFLNAEALRGDANQQVKLGWMEPPLPIDLEGSVDNYEEGAVNIAFLWARARLANSGQATTSEITWPTYDARYGPRLDPGRTPDMGLRRPNAPGRPTYDEADP